ncbi:DUF1415 domain-containing protein [Thiomicrorhabdus aquaedulcis]|uniref:DUF1415 domain-containing protein n=1 Tax=Thiomicrorhabdus aquaedulcis TaxID=2211106 RepID=UPI000FD7FBB6|nr:DUF1415 domain-containing protein [Thiomicrorhabdus aquaedulcis]
MPHISPVDQQTIEARIRAWLEQVVIGLNLCPFAAHPYQNDQVHIAISPCTDKLCLLTQLQTELHTLEQQPSIETTVLVIPNLLHDFDDYNQFLDLVDDLVAQQGWEGIFQVASFHPHYQFGGTQPEDAENLTNRAPYPILHLLREDSLERALENHPNPQAIFEHNIATVQALSDTEKAKLFPHLFG